MIIAQLDTRVRRQVNQFIDLPFRLYRRVPQWVPPLVSEARRMLDRRRHPFYAHSEVAFYLALEDGSAIGRLAVCDNRNYNAYNLTSKAFFCLFECDDNRAASQALFEAAMAWARARGLTEISGPRGLTALDGLGLLVGGFEHRPALGIPYNLPYYPALIEAAGFRSVEDIVSGYLAGSARFPDRIHRLSRLVQERRGLHIARYRTRCDLCALVPHLRDMYNAAIDPRSDNVPLTADEARTMAAQLLRFADPRLLKVVMKGDEPVGFLFAYPDVSEALQRCRGRLFPFGWLEVLLELRRTRWVNVNGAAIVEQYRGLGGTAILFSEMAQSIAEGRFLHADIVQVGADNARMQRELRDLGIDFYKTHRLYAREL